MIMLDVEILRAACCLAGIDREISDAERRVLTELAATAGVGQASFEAMMARARRDPEFYKDQFKLTQKDPEKAIMALLRVAFADGRLGNRERQLVVHFAEKVKLDRGRLDAMLAPLDQRSSAENTNA